MEHDDGRKTLGPESIRVDRPADGREVAIDDGGVDHPGAGGIAGVDFAGSEVEHDGHGRGADRAGTRDDRSAMVRPGVRGIDDCRQAGLEPPVELVVQDPEGPISTTTVGSWIDRVVTGTDRTGSQRATRRTS